MQSVRRSLTEFTKLGCVSKLKTYLERRRIRGKQRISQTGRKTGGAAYSRGALYSILQNRIYLGEIEHRGQVYHGEHQGVVPRELWERAQAQLRANNNAHQNGLRAAMPSLLVGLLYDERGNRFTPAHAVKNGKRYRYYVSQAAIKNPGGRHRGLARIPAGEIESLACSRLRSFLRSPHEVVDTLALQGTNAAATQSVLAAAQELSKRLASAGAAETRPVIRNLISRIVVHPESVDVLLDKQALRSALLDGLSPMSPRADLQNGFLRLKVKARLKRCGGEMRLVLPANSGGEIPVHLVPSLIKAVARAHDWYRRIIRGELTGSRSIAHTAGLDERYVSRILQGAFLAPDIVASILDGRQPAKMTFENFRAHLPNEWAAQRQLLGFSAR